MALLGGEAVPGNGLSVILWDAFAGAVHDSEVVLGGGVALLGGQTVPDDRFGII